ncbi:MAG TPA: response regulator transcription factor [Nitriliruptorales bacterium]|nr:response regulator transcription factor [Nitriliruptorales bacterium]
MKVLVVEDEPRIAALLRRTLEREGHAVDLVGTGDEAIWMGLQREFDAIVLDIRLPGPDGFEVTRRLRESGCWSPILLLTGQAAVEDRVRGLDAGADDFLAKPFAIAELQARLRALSRRNLRERPPTLTAGGVVLDPASRTVERDGAPIQLSPKEFALLELFLRHPGEVLTRQRILEYGWDFAQEGGSNVVDVYIRYLRDKVDRPFARHSIETVRGVGYRFNPEG